MRFPGTFGCPAWVLRHADSLGHLPSGPGPPRQEVWPRDNVGPAWRVPAAALAHPGRCIRGRDALGGVDRTFARPAAGAQSSKFAVLTTGSTPVAAAALAGLACAVSRESKRGDSPFRRLLPVRTHEFSRVALARVHGHPHKFGCPTLTVLGGENWSPASPRHTRSSLGCIGSSNASSPVSEQQPVHRWPPWVHGATLTQDSAGGSRQNVACTYVRAPHVCICTT